MVGRQYQHFYLILALPFSLFSSSMLVIATTAISICFSVSTAISGVALEPFASKVVFASVSALIALTSAFAVFYHFVISI